MLIGFPMILIEKLMCTLDGGKLQLQPQHQLDDCGALVTHGALQCQSCASRFPIEAGIVDMGVGALDDESRHERALRDRDATNLELTGVTWYDNAVDPVQHNAMEMDPTIQALDLESQHSLLELGCGDGRFTRALASKVEWLMAVDFSRESLRVLQRRHRGANNVGLVLGDIGTLALAPTGFDRILSTLTSNLPTRELRNAMYRLAAHAAKSDGRFVFSAHHHGLRQKLYGIEKSGAYDEGGIYRYNLTLSECRAEVKPYFDDVIARTVQIYLPLSNKLKLPVLPISRALERIPVVNTLGDLVLCTAQLPSDTSSSAKSASTARTRARPFPTRSSLGGPGGKPRNSAS